MNSHAVSGTRQLPISLCCLVAPSIMFKFTPHNVVEQQRNKLRLFLLSFVKVRLRKTYVYVKCSTLNSAFSFGVSPAGCVRRQPSRLFHD
jgi:hypothetical protein